MHIALRCSKAFFTGTHQHIILMLHISYLFVFRFSALNVTFYIYNLITIVILPLWIILKQKYYDAEEFKAFAVEKHLLFRYVLIILFCIFDWSFYFILCKSAFVHTILSWNCDEFFILTMCVSVIGVRNTSKPFLSGSVPNLELHFSVIYCYHFVLQIRHHFYYN